MAHTEKLYRTRVPHIEYDPVQIHCEGGTITNKFMRELRTSMTLPALLDYTCDRNKIDPQWIKQVDWRALAAFDLNDLPEATAVFTGPA